MFLVQVLVLFSPLFIILFLKMITFNLIFDFPSLGLNYHLPLLHCGVVAPLKIDEITDKWKNCDLNQMSLGAKLLASQTFIVGRFLC